MATITPGYAFATTEQVTAAKLASLAGGTISSIVNADISVSAAIADTKLAQITTASKVSGAAITSLASTPSGAGTLPIANIPYKDEDDMASDSATHVSTQQSVKAYVTSSVPVKASGAEIDTGSNDTKFATPKAIADSGLLFSSFVDRGDPASADFAHGGLTIDTAYHGLDLSSIVPAGAKAVLLRCSLGNATAGVYIAFRENGNNNGINIDRWVTAVASGPGMYHSFVVACDANRVIEYAVQNSGSWSIGITVGGWWL